MRTLLLVLLGFVGTLPVFAQSGGGAYSLDDLAFIPGRWQGTLDGGTIEEHWSTPEGDNLMGMFRYVRGGTALFYELMLIEQTDEGPVLTVKHFSPRLIGWEEKDEVNSYPLVSLTPGRAVFERPDGATRLVFERQGTDSLTVTLEKLQDGGWQADAFSYRRMP